MKQKLPCIVCVIVLALLLFTTDASAQRYRSNRGNGRANNYYSYNYRPARPYIAVNIGRYNNYRQPYYSRPVYRTHSYIHFGPSFGVRISVLPVGYYPFYVGPNPYYYDNGVYYRPYNGGGYEVIQAPLGATVKHLPSGTKLTVIDGQKYYELGGTYYQEEITEKNQLRYKVVGTEGVLNTGEGVTTNDNTPGTAADKAEMKAKILPETGARFDKLPEGSKTVIIKKEKYYLSPDGVYYQEVVDGDNIRYEVTGNSAAE